MIYEVGRANEKGSTKNIKIKIDSKINPKRHRKTANKSMIFARSKNQAKSVHGAPNGRNGAPGPPVGGCDLPPRGPQIVRKEKTPKYNGLGGGDHTRFKA